MKYNLHNQYVVNENVLKPRCYYIPFTNKEFSYDKTKSSEVCLLSKWKFSYFPCFSDEIIKKTPIDDVVVPFNWQRQGYDYDQYLNTYIQFPCEPPYILMDDPCGLYQTNYIVKNKSGKYFINFEGVDSCFYLFINGKYVGYATISHVINEFDITKFLKKGNNIVKVVVLKWCAGSYLEVQDKLRQNGIFRDVYILNRPEDHIFDYKIEANKLGEIKCKFDKEVEISLYDKKKLLVTKKGKTINLKINNPILWNAENPYLYRLVISYNGEFIEEKIGFRSVEIRDCVLYLNDTPIKIRGVNRHSSTVNGYVESVDDLVKDLKLFKQFNINAVRTSHYPPHPLFPKLCEEFGIYVMLESDIETHVAAYYKMSNLNFSDITTNKNFEPMYFERIIRAYERDKNRTSVIFWSLGNESGYSQEDEGYSNFTRGAEYIIAHDGRPIHYEGTILPWKDGEWYHRKEHVLSVYSRMYPPYRDIDRYFDGFYTEKHLNMEKRPYIMCEYSHAMGNSCGDIKYFWDHYINKHPEFIGGFIWQWNNGGVLKDNKFSLGADYKTKLHAGNLCANGLVDIDRNFLHSSLYEVSEAYSPFDVVKKGEKIYIQNKRDFESLDDYSCVCEIKQNGLLIKSFDVDINNMKPKSNKLVKIPDYKVNSGYITLDFTLTNKKFKMVSYRQIVLSDNYPISKFEPNAIKAKNNVISFKNIRYVFNRHGLIEQIIFNDDNLLSSPMEVCVYRAPTDNDAEVYSKWKPWFLDMAKFYAFNVEYKEKKVVAEGFVAVPTRTPICKATITYEFNEKGNAKISIKAHVNEIMVALPRFGFRFPLNKSFKNLSYFGAGSLESYEDKHAHSPVGLYKTSVKNNEVPYVTPQESGAHAFTRMVELNNGKCFFKIERTKDFSFNASIYDLYNLPKHLFELKDSGNVYLNIDYRNSPVGSMSCNHILNFPFTYTITEKDIDFSFNLIIGKDGNK